MLALSAIFLLAADMLVQSIAYFEQLVGFLPLAWGVSGLAYGFYGLHRLSGRS